jgi:peptide/nickel transport system substrate-binding protein
VRLTVATPGGRGYTFVLHQLVAAGIRCTPADVADADLLVCEWTPAWAANHGRDRIHRLWQPAGRAPSARVAELAAAALRREDSSDPRHWAAVDAEIAREGDVLPLVSAAWPRAVAEAAAPGSGRFAGPVR